LPIYFWNLNPPVKIDGAILKQSPGGLCRQGKTQFIFGNKN
jgi:hypothetical protein